MLQMALSARINRTACCICLGFLKFISALLNLDLKLSWEPPETAALELFPLQVESFCSSDGETGVTAASKGARRSVPVSFWAARHRGSQAGGRGEERRERSGAAEAAAGRGCCGAGLVLRPGPPSPPPRSAVFRLLSVKRDLIAPINNRWKVNPKPTPCYRRLPSPLLLERSLGGCVFSWAVSLSDLLIGFFQCYVFISLLFYFNIGVHICVENLQFFLFPLLCLIIYHPIHFFMLIPTIPAYSISAIST